MILALGFAQVYTGFGQWGKPGKVPHGAIVAWGVLLAFWTIVYLAGFVLLPKQWEQRKAELGEEKQQEVYDVGVGEGRRSSVAPFNRASVDA